MGLKITLPHNYIARDYQKAFWRAMKVEKKKRADLCWHRRSGKEKTSLNFTITEMPERAGSYYYMFPESLQGRKVLWDGADKDGFRFLDHFPKDYIRSMNNTEMKIRTKDNSLFQIVGSDNFNSIMGTNPLGIVFSEFSLQDPMAWSYFRPILAENNGWAVFNYTPRGDNHARELHDLAKNDPDWFSQVLTVNDTHAIPEEILQREKSEIVRLDGNDAMYQQEYFCSFSSPLAGSYYSHCILQAYTEGRIGDVPWDKRYLVDTWWDLGKGDNMAVWFTQAFGAKVKVIDYISGIGAGIVDYIKMIREKPYQYGRHVGPHDLVSTEIFNGKTRLGAASEIGFDFDVCPKISIQDGIDAVRNIFPVLYFDEAKCKDGLNALKNYTKQWDETRKTYLNYPFHNWASHASDALRTMAVGMDDEFNDRKVPSEDKYERAFLRNRQIKRPVFI